MTADRRLARVREGLRRRLATPGINLARAELVLDVMREWGEPIHLAELHELLPEIPFTQLKADHGPVCLLIAEGRVARLRPGVYYADPDLTPTLTGGRHP